jgi:poly(hydroxyalkanoate) depolymerase family esterase
MRRRAHLLACWLVGTSACATDEMAGSSSGELTEVVSFGSNPGGLRMWLYAPSRPASPAAVVVALHGCTQSAADIERTGWSTIAEQAGFYVIYPQQTSSNNGASCFRWFEPAHVRRGSGEVASIAAMVSHVKSRYAIDDARVFAAGFSAGGGMAPALLAAYPDVFAAGAAHSGLPVGCATGVSNAFDCQNGNVDRSGSDWAARARANGPSGWAGPWPRLAVWQGTSDFTVRPKNAEELVEQFTSLNGIDAIADESTTVAALTRTRHVDGASVRVESWTLPGAGHAVAIDAPSCGASGAFAVDVDVCAAREQARFFGLLDAAPSSDGGVPSVDASVVIDAGVDAGRDAGVDAGRDAGVDAGRDAGLVDSGVDATREDAGADAGSPSTCVEHTSSNYAHERAGRGTRCGSFRSYVCANGSGESMGSGTPSRPPHFAKSRAGTSRSGAASPAEPRSASPRVCRQTDGAPSHEPSLAPLAARRPVGRLA